MKIKHVCKGCGSESVYWEATVYWDVETQILEIGGDIDISQDTAFCGDCGAEDCAKIILMEETAP